MWKEGSIKVNGDIFHYWIKQYEEGSEWGIEGGRISKLMLKRGGKIVCNYDRGWDVEPADENTQLALQLLLHSENWYATTTQSNGSERGCCSLYGRSHRFRWRLFFIPFGKNEKHLPFLIDAFPAQKRRSVEIIGVAVAHPVKICVQPKFVEQRCLPLCFLLTS